MADASRFRWSLVVETLTLPGSSLTNIGLAGWPSAANEARPLHNGSGTYALS